MQSFSAAIICPLREEAAAIARRCHDIKSIGGNFSEAKYSDNYGTLRILIGQPDHKGPISAAILTAAMAANYSFDYVCLSGICGSLSGPFESRAEVGDVIFADSVIKFENAKFFRDDLETSSYSILTDDYIVSQFRKYLIQGLTRSTRRKLSSSKYGRQNPVIIIGPMVSTESVIKSSRYSRKIAESLRKKINSMRPLAVEMEYAGVYEATKYFNINSNLFMIRAVNDMSDENKYLQQADNRRNACENAAEISLDFLSFLINIRGNE